MKDISSAEMKCHNSSHTDLNDDVYYLGDCPRCDEAKPTWRVKRYVILISEVRGWDKEEAIFEAVGGRADDMIDIKETAIRVPKERK